MDPGAPYPGTGLKAGLEELLLRVPSALGDPQPVAGLAAGGLEMALYMWANR